jgi:hypothetical protein
LGVYTVTTHGVLDYTVIPVLRGHAWDKEKVAFKDSRPHMEFSMTGYEKVGLLIQVTA